MRIPWMQQLGIVAALALGSNGAGAASVEAMLGLPASLDFDAVADQCENNPGPFITLSGELSIGGVGGRLIFRNNEKGTHERSEDVTVDLELLEAGETIRFAKQPPEGGVGGNPYIWVQFYDGGWKAISDPILLGRCVQGIHGGALLFQHLADAAVDVQLAGECSNSPGPEISLDGAIVLGGLNAKLIFTNNAKGTHRREEVTSVDLEILPAGESIAFPKQPPLGGVGGNPRIYFQFVDDEGGALSSEVYLGRCVQLSK